VAPCNRSLDRWFLLTALGAGGTEILVLSVMITQLEHDSSGVMSSLIYLCSLLGVSLMGIFGDALLQAYANRTIGIGTSLGCAALCLMAITVQDTWAAMALTGLISFFSALGGPNITATFARLLGGNRASGMANYQSLSVAIAIASPMLGALLISAGRSGWALMIVRLLHVIPIIPWLLLTGQHRDAQDGSRNFRDNALVGYRCILSVRELRMMTTSRLLNNVLYIGLPVSMPLIIAAMHLEPVEAAWTQASGISAIRFGALCGRTILAFLLSRNSAISRWLPTQTLVCGLALIALISVVDDPISLEVACAIAGLGQFAFRLSGTTFGPAVTPENKLAHVILAGDTIVRLFSAVYGLVLIALVGATGQPAYTLLGLSAFAIPAPFLMRPAVQKHCEALKNEETKNKR
jgi:MFS family permease